MTVALIRLGKMGSRVVRLLEFFGYRKLAADANAALAEEDKADGVRQDMPGKRLQQPDIATPHAHVTSKTGSLVDRDVFQAMKYGPIFVNTARGSPVDCHALDSWHPGGPALKSLVVERIPCDSPLLGRESVVLAPHIAGASIRTARNTDTGVAEDVRRCLSGERSLQTC